MKHRMEPVSWYKGKCYIQIKLENECLLYKKDGSFKQRMLINDVTKDTFMNLVEFIEHMKKKDPGFEPINENIVSAFRYIGFKVYLQINLK